MIYFTTLGRPRSMGRLQLLVLVFAVSPLAVWAKSAERALVGSTAQPTYLASSIPIIGAVTETSVLGYRMLAWPVQASLQQLQQNLAVIPNCEPIAITAQNACVNEFLLISFQETKNGFIWSEAAPATNHSSSRPTQYQLLFSSLEGMNRSTMWKVSRAIADVYRTELHHVSNLGANIVIQDMYTGSFVIEAEATNMRISIMGWRESADSVLVTQVEQLRGNYD